jgi:UDP-GlcNAc:undecaprenyl-phosphate GlcNAc-1-phosphate transferase
MVWLCLALIPAALLISLLMSAILVRLGHRLGTFDSPGVPGQVKDAPRRVPNTGGIAIFWAIAAPMLLGLAYFHGVNPSHDAQWRTGWTLIPADAHEYVAGIRQMTPMALLLLASLFLLHLLGLVDDRRPLGPWVKLTLMAVPAAAVPLLSDTRLLTLLDGHVGGAWLSIGLTVLWFVVVSNALNFMDNMDGLSAGVTAIAGTCFLAATLSGPHPQWFVAACLALMVGACLGFLAFNAPRRGGARIFMGDGGSLVLGFLLAFLTARTTYVPATAPPALSGAWHAVFMPLVVLAVPLYDFTSVVLIRLSQGRSPFIGDLQHLSHRLTQRGLSRAAAVYMIWGLTAVTGLSGILLASSRPWQAAMICAQTLIILLVIALFEYTIARGSKRA